MTRIYGPDVSNVNRKNIDAALAKRQGCSFVAFKVTQGTGFIDAYAKENRKRVEDEDLLPIQYYFLERGNGKAQAEFAVKQAESLGDPHLVGHAKDVETQNKIGVGPLIQDVIDFQQRWSELMPGIPCGTYSGNWYWQGHLNNPPFVGDWLWDSTYLLGHAEPGVLVQQATPGYWRAWGHRAKYDLRQFTSNSITGGIDPCDCSVFEGDIDQLRKLILPQTRGFTMLGFAQGRDCTLLNLFFEFQSGVGTSDIAEVKTAIQAGDPVIVCGGPAVAALGLQPTIGRSVQGASNNITVLNGQTGKDTANLVVAELTK